jgi:hypothetical protein
MRIDLTDEQLSLLSGMTVDIGALAKTAKKDEERIKLFVLAVARKEAEYAMTALATLAIDPVKAGEIAAEATRFSKGAANLVQDWLVRFKKLSLADLWRDPYKELRQQTRVFAADWDLDPAFRQAMG